MLLRANSNTTAMSFCGIVEEETKASGFDCACLGADHFTCWGVEGYVFGKTILFPNSREKIVADDNEKMVCCFKGGKSSLPLTIENPSACQKFGFYVG